jgi:hypothetical protein
VAVRGWPSFFEGRFALPLRQPTLFWILAFTLFISTEVDAELNSGDLNTARMVTEADWLRLQLSFLGLKLSYPAYRIDLKLTEDNVIEFSFNASGGMAKHLTEETGKAEAEEVITYHARGLRDQVEELIRDEFPTIWASFDARSDIHGHFIGPGKDWEDPPREIGTWLEGEFSWEQ